MNIRALLLLSLLLLPWSPTAGAREGDPVAYKCYYCTPEEREASALAMGVGEHYIYDARIRDGIFGYRVTTGAHGLVAEAFEPAYWLRTQYSEMMKVYKPDEDVFRAEIGTVSLYPPGSSHGRSDQRLWGYHLSTLHPQHAIARETVRRMLDGLAMLRFLEADTEGGGRILRFWFQLDDSNPLTIRLNFIHTYLGSADFYFDHDQRRWEYLDSRDFYNTLQETQADFLGPTGQRTFNYPYTYSQLQPYFVQRANWAGITVQGELPVRDNVQFVCDEGAGTPVCHVQ